MAAHCNLPHSTMQAKQYGYHCGNTVDLSTVMPAVELRVTDEEGAYLCAAHGLIFKGSVLAYDPTREEVEWVPTRGVANNLSWVEERMAVALANFVPRASQEADHIAELGHVTWPGLMTPPWKRRARRCRRKMTCTRKCRRKMTYTRRCGRQMSIYPHPSWRIMSTGWWRDEGTQTPKHHLVMRCMVRARLNQRES